METNRLFPPVSILSAVLAAFAVAGVSVAQDESAAPQPVPALEQKEPGDTPVDTLVQHVKPGKDGWVTELYDEEIKLRLKKLKSLLHQRPLDTAKVLELVADEFRGTPLTPAKTTALREKAPAVARWELRQKKTLTADSLPEELGAWLARLRRIDSSELKTTGVTLLEREPPLVASDIRYTFTGRTEEGAVLQLSGYWTTQWRKDPQRGWLWQEVEAEKAWEGQTPRPLFTDVTACALPHGAAYEQLARGIDWWSAHLEMAAGVDIYGHNGVAVADVDGDGRQDFYVCQPQGLPNRLFRAKPDGTYRQSAQESGVDVLDRSSMAVFFDYDNDGDPDLLVAGMQLLLFENDGQGRFRFQPPAEVGLTPAKGEKTLLTSTCIGDYNRDGWLDIYVCSYAWQVGETGYNYPLPYHDANNGSPNFLFRNNGDGTFTDVTEQIGLAENNTRFSFACSWGDYDNDGWPDLYVANDFGRNNLYRNLGGRFRDVAPKLGVEDIGAGMSVAWGDYDNDGWLDLYVGNMYSTAGLRTTSQTLFKPGSAPTVQRFFRRHAKGNTLFRNRGDGTFEEVTGEAGVGMGRWAWASDFFDLDLDGYEDIFITNGFITNESTQDL